MGAGSGFISIALAVLFQKATVCGIEIQKNLVELARQNARLNEVSHRTHITAGDIRDASVLPAHYSQDLVVANPPFRKLQTGRVSPQMERAASCHEISASLSDYIYSASLILKHLGYFALVMLPERIPELFALLRERKLHPWTLKTIHHTPNYDASAVLVIARKESRGGFSIMPPRFVK